MPKTIPQITIWGWFANHPQMGGLLLRCRVVQADFDLHLQVLAQDLIWNNIDSDVIYIEFRIYVTYTDVH